MLDEAELVTAGDVAKLARVTPATVRMWGQSNRLPMKRTAGGVRLFRRADVDRLMAERGGARGVSAVSEDLARGYLC